MLILLVGSLIAQSFPIFVTPILTRIYTPTQFGIYSMYSAALAILGVVASLRLDLAIVITKKRFEAVHLFQIAVLTSVTLTVVLFTLYLIIYNIPYFSNYAKNNIWVIFVIIGLSFYTLYNVINAWYNRNGRYRSLTLNRVFQSFSITSSQLTIGFIFDSIYLLLIGDLFGRILSQTVSLFRLKILKKLIRFSKLMILTLKRYSGFPKLELPASLFNVASFQLPYFIIPILFTTSVAGQYFIVYRVLMVPIALIGNAILDVYKNKAIEELEKNNTFKTLFLKTGLFLFLITIIPTSLLILFGPELFRFVLGKEWESAGVFAQILAPMAAIRFISSPLGYSLILREKLSTDLILQMLLFFATLISLALGWYFNSVIFLVACLSITGTVFYSSQIIISYWLTDK